MTEYCKGANVPFSTEEDFYYRLNQHKKKFQLFKTAVNHCYESGRPEQIEVGMSVLQGKEGAPPSEKLTKDYTDLRNYMPAIATAFDKNMPLH